MKNWEGLTLKDGIRDS